MVQYYVEGVFLNKQSEKKTHKAGHLPGGTIALYARAIWANSPQEAILIATGELDGGHWTEGPRASLITEEQRMRSMGAPEFPGLATTPTKKRKY